MTNDPRGPLDGDAATTDTSEAFMVVESEPMTMEAEAEQPLDNEYDDEPEPRRGVMQISKAAFWSIIGAGVLAIVGLAAATTWLALDRGGESDPVVATVNGEQIRRSEYDRAVASNSGADVLDGLIAERLVTSEARKRNIVIDDAATESLLNEQRERFGGDQGLQAALSQAGLSMEELTKQLRLSELLRRMVSDKIVVSDQEVEAAYSSNTDRFQGQSLDQVKEQLRGDLSEQKERSAVQEFLEQARGEATIETKLPGTTS